MKYLFSILFFTMMSCADDNTYEIRKVENFLGVTIPKDNVNITSSNEGLKQSLIIIDITFDSKEYARLMKKINLKEFEKDGNNNYYKNVYFEDEDKKIYVILFSNEHRIRYAEKE